MGCLKLPYQTAENAISALPESSLREIAKNGEAVKNTLDYYAGGSPLPGRSGSSDSYRYGLMGYEKDDELKGIGNSYDMGARILDPRLVRPLSVDPLAAQFPHQSPYVFANNNPIYYIDQNGESGVGYITGETNKETGRPILKVVSNVYLYGEAATQTRADALETSLNTEYNQGFTWTDANGTTYDLQFEINVEARDYANIESDIKSSTTEDNFYYVEANNPDRKASQTTNAGRLGGSIGILKAEDLDNVPTTGAHEMNHGYGGRNHPPANKPSPVRPGQTIPIAIPKTQTYSDGSPLNLEDRHVTQWDIDFIMKNSEFGEKQGIKKGEIGVNTGKFPNGDMQKPDPNSSTGVTSFE